MAITLLITQIILEFLSGFSIGIFFLSISVSPRRGGAPSVDGGSSGLVLNKIVKGELLKEVNK